MRVLILVSLLAAACGPGVAAELETTTTSPTTTLAPSTTTTASVPTAATTTTTEPGPSLPQVDPPSSRGRLVIHGTGDVNLWERYAGTDPEATWGPLRSIFQSDDLTVINLECTPSELGEPLPKEFNFRCPLASLPIMAEAGVDVANLANNHSQDFGQEAMLDGRRNVLASGVEPVGVGENLAVATMPALFEIKGWTVAVLGFGGVVIDSGWLATTDRPGMASGDDGELIAEAVRRADALADIVVVTIHWGSELETVPRQGDILLAEAMIEAGADMIFGHHQHRLNPMTFVDGRPVAWGLGNFIWQVGSGDASRTALAQVIVEPDGTVRGCLIPARIVGLGVVEVDDRQCAPAQPSGY